MIQAHGRLVLRADSGPRGGVGHVMRCLALGEEWVARGGSATLIGDVNGEGVERRLRAVSIDSVESRASPGSDADLAALLDITTGASAVVIDGYDFGGAYLKLAGAALPLAVIADDANVAVPESTVIINHHGYADEESYSASSPGAVKALGPTFALLRRELRDAPRDRDPEPERATKVLVTAGGADTNGISGHLLRQLRSAGREDLSVRVIVGPVATSSWAAEEVSGDAGDIEIVVDPPSMAPHFRWADIAIATAGGTALELAYFGVPALLLTVAPNQRPVAEAMKGANAALNIGSIPEVVDQLPHVFESLANDRARRQQMSDAGRRLVDGKGASRLIDLLAGVVEARLVGLRLRPVLREDEAAVLSLANSTGTRENSLNPRKIGGGEHARWFSDKLQRDATRMWVLDAGGELACQVRYDRMSPGEAEVAIATASSWRGQGLATRMLRMTAPLAFASLRVSQITAVVVSDNAPSTRAFASAGYDRAGESCIGGRMCVSYRLESVLA